MDPEKTSIEDALPQVTPDPIVGSNPSFPQAPQQTGISPSNLSQQQTPHPKKPFFTKKLIIITAILFTMITLAGGGIFAYQKLGNNGLFQSGSNCSLTLDEKTFPNRILDAKIFGGIQKGGFKTIPASPALVAAAYFGNPISQDSAENGLSIKINNESDIYEGINKADKRKIRQQELTLKAIKNQISKKEKEELADLLGLKNNPERLEVKKIDGLPVYLIQDKPSNSGTVVYGDTKTKLIMTMMTIRTSHSVEEYFTEWQKQVCKKLPPTEIKNEPEATLSAVIDTSDWNLYENPKLGYSIKTPPDFTKDDSLVNSSLATVIFKSANFKKEMVKDPLGSIPQGEHLEAVEGLSIEVRSSTTTSTLDDEYLGRYSDNKVVKNKTYQEPFKLANFPDARGVRSKYSYQGILPVDEIMIVANGHVLIILLSYPTSYPENNISQILSTLQLL